MPIEDETAIANRRLWEAQVEKGCGYTIPWLNLDVSVLRRFARGEIESLPGDLSCLSPSSVFADVKDRDVLCLAAGGGQQSAAFGLLGARVTVVDLAAGQLRSDTRAAEHYGYDVTVLRADMRDLSCLADGSFDLVYQADSLSYVPDVRQVYREVARVLRIGGIYRTKHYQPAVQFLEHDGTGYRVAKPYIETIHRRDDGGLEFRHYMDDIFNGLADAGLALKQVVDLGRNRRPDPTAEPGGWEHEERYVGGGFVIVAGKTQKLG